LIFTKFFLYDSIRFCLTEFNLGAKSGDRFLDNSSVIAYTSS